MLRFLFWSFSFLAIVSAQGEEALSAAGCDGGTRKCLNGGSCVEGIAKSTGKEIQVCDCLNAIDEKGDRYVGLHCEVQAFKKDKFCINGGTPKTIQTGIIVCHCPEEYTGAYCELSKNATEVQALLPNDSSEECDMPCFNDGICALGRRAPTLAESELYPEFNPIDDGKGENAFFYEHCQCPDGFYGTHCESSYVICSGSTVDDDDYEHYCHNNSTCISAEDTMKLDGTEADASEIGLPGPMCNCTAAHSPGKHFTGKYCEFENVLTCNDKSTDLLQRNFCSSGGTCVKDIDGAWSCKCPEGYTGKHCEKLQSGFLQITEDMEQEIDEEDNEESEEVCKKTICQNGGTCHTEIKDDSSILGRMKSTNVLIRCICPSGFTGTLCERQVDVCPDGKHMCFRNSKCVLVDESRDEYICSCNTASSGNASELGGNNCQYEATSTCESGISCFNNGTCNGDKCLCIDGYSGPYCTLSSSSMRISEENSGTRGGTTPSNPIDTKDVNSMLVIGGVIIVLTTFWLMTSVAMRVYERKRNENNVVDERSVPLSNPKRRPPNISFSQTPSLPSVSFDVSPSPISPTTGYLQTALSSNGGRGIRRHSFLTQQRLVNRSNMSALPTSLAAISKGRHSISSPYMTPQEEKALTDLL